MRHVQGSFPGPVAECAPFDTESASMPGAPIGAFDLVLPEPARFEGQILEPDCEALTGCSILFRRTGQDQFAFNEWTAVTSGGHFSLGPLAAGEGQLILTRRTGGVDPRNTAPLPTGSYLLDTVTIEPGEAASGEYASPLEPLREVHLAVVGAGLQGEVHSAVMARVPSGPSATASAEGPLLGPFRLEAGAHTVWMAGNNWVAHADGVQVPDVDGATVSVAVELTSKRIKIMVDGEVLALHTLKLMGVPTSLGVPRLKTDPDGFLDLRLGAGTYRLYPAQAGDSMELMLRSAILQWPLPIDVDEVTLEPY